MNICIMGLPGIEKTKILNKIETWFTDVTTINTDIMVSKLYEDEKFLEEIYLYFSYFRDVSGIYYDSKKGLIFNKHLFGACIFNNQDHINYLYSKIHPIVKAKVSAIIESTNFEDVIIECPVPFIAGINEYCHKTFLIDIPISYRLNRIIDRGWDIEDMQHRDKQILLELTHHGSEIETINEDYIINTIEKELKK